MSLPPSIVALLLAAAVGSLVGAPAAAQPGSEPGWPHPGNDLGGARYSAAAQIDRTNVGQLRLAWTYRTGALGRSAPLDRKAAFEARPMTYRLDGRQYLVIAAGGHDKLGTRQGDYVLAFTLP